MYAIHNVMYDTSLKFTSLSMIMYAIHYVMYDTFEHNVMYDTFEQPLAGHGLCCN